MKYSEEELKKKYTYQGGFSDENGLTSKLDNLGGDFSQEIINEIVLWKVSRYAKLLPETLKLLNKIDKNSLKIEEDLTKSVLIGLLKTKGIQLAMASTILRFKNPKIYQIIDQRVFRVIYPKEIKSLQDFLKNKSDPEQADFYLKYLMELEIFCKEKNFSFEISDRTLYQLDKMNGQKLKKQH